MCWDWYWEREDHHELLSWQCLNCGAVVEKPVYELVVVRFDRIVLRPGELERMRGTAAGAALPLKPKKPRLRRRPNGP
jgi:hypothetical protein